MDENVLKAAQSVTAQQHLDLILDECRMGGHDPIASLQSAIATVREFIPLAEDTIKAIEKERGE